MKIHLPETPRRPGGEFKYEPDSSVLKILNGENMLRLSKRRGKYFWLVVGDSKIGLPRKALLKLSDELREMANK